jgi:hypothetical protein
MKKMETIMPKAKSAIKVIAIVLLTGFHKGAQSQNKTIDGLFCRVYLPSDDFGNCLEFKKNNTFEYKFSGDLGMQSYAQGEYELGMDRLILNYNKTKPLKMSYHVSEIWQSNKDSITVDFNFFDFDGNPAKEVDIFYRDSLSAKNIFQIFPMIVAGFRLNKKKASHSSSLKFRQRIMDLAHQFCMLFIT